MTYQEFLDELTPEELEKYLKNTPKEVQRINIKCNIGNRCLIRSFFWVESDEGHDYWEEINKRISQKHGDDYIDYK